MMHRPVLSQFSSENRGRTNFRDALASLQKSKSPWLSTTLGTWSVGNDTYPLEQFLFVGPRSGGDYIRVGIFAGIHGDETASFEAGMWTLYNLVAGRGGACPISGNVEITI